MDISESIIERQSPVVVLASADVRPSMAAIGIVMLVPSLEYEGQSEVGALLKAIVALPQGSLAMSPVSWSM